MGIRRQGLGVGKFARKGGRGIMMSVKNRKVMGERFLWGRRSVGVREGGGVSSLGCCGMRGVGRGLLRCLRFVWPGAGRGGRIMGRVVDGRIILV
jgi:hypothetical protein